MKNRKPRLLSMLVAPPALLLAGTMVSIAPSLPATSFGDGPSSSEVKKLVAEYVELDGTVEEERARQDEILALLEPLDPLTKSSAKSWKKKIAKLWSKGPKLEKKSGRRYLWEKENRGLFILGGETKRPKGLLIGMHGGGKGSGDAWSSHGAYNSVASKENWLGIFPEVLVKTECGWTDSGTEEFVLELVERALCTWKIDRNQVFFGGHSMGGYGSWTLGAHHADLVAGLIPSAGAPTPIMNRDEVVVDVVEGVIPNLRNTSIIVYQSDDDPQVPPDANQMAVKKLQEAKERWGGFDFEYWEVSGYGHGAPPGGYLAHAAKIRDKVRNPRPDKIVWEQELPWKRQFYWLWCERPEAFRLIVAELDRDKNEVRITCKGDHGGLHVLVDEELVDLAREVVVLLNDEEVFRGQPTLSLQAVLSTGAKGDSERTYTARIPLAR
jgi:predicted esterase